MCLVTCPVSVFSPVQLLPAVGRDERTFHCALTLIHHG